ncbi:MFS transporter, partial [Bradyrhizobium sp.]|uniref:MFS transporter n=1 Tax=Bradyrhizobium sp. TaxID=376 RepID=UPI003C66AF6C
MTATDLKAEADFSVGTNRLGVYLAFLQFVFTLLWAAYVVYLPKLAAEVGMAPGAVILILMMDQAIFTVTDTAMGIAADRISALTGRLGVFVGALTAISCAAFVALPFVAGAGMGARTSLIALIATWAITSSALRAPPLILLAQHSARPQLPFLSAVVLLGYGLAGALSPYLGAVLRDRDPRLPFAIASVVLLFTALLLSKVERDGAAIGSPVKPSRPAKPFGTIPMIFVAAMIALALGYQLHFSINSEPFYLRFARRADLPWLMPVFWIGFNIAMFPASRVMRHRGGLIVMGIAGLFGAVAVLVAEMAGNLTTLVVAQFIAGSAWGCML